jgi:hypothetical protein
MKALRYLDRVLTDLTRVRTTGMSFVWPTDSGVERSEAAPTPARRRTGLPYVAPVVTVIDRDHCD